MPFNVKKGADGVQQHPPQYLQLLNNIIMEQVLRVTVRLDLESEATKLVRVKAHKRHLKDKVVIVRSHYRRVLVRE